MPISEISGKKMPQIVNLYYKDEVFKIVGICMEIHSILGHGFLEIVYKDAIQYELKKLQIEFEREKEFFINYKDTILTLKFYADFVVFGNIILEVKATENGLCDEYISRLLNYLKASGCKVGLLVNFGRSKLEFKRLVF